MTPHASRVVAYDLSTSVLEVVADAPGDRVLHNIVTQQRPAEGFAFAGDTFDLVNSRYSADHWSDIEAAPRETVRALKSQGQLCAVDAVGTPLRMPPL